jgi:hypothetical protein
MTKEIRTLGFPSVPIHRLVDEIAQAHAGPSGLNIPRLLEDTSTAHRSYQLYPRALAAIVRFADEVSENHSRVSHALLNDVPGANQVYWQYASCISASVPDPSRERVVVTFEIPADKIASKFPCAEYPDRIKDGCLTLIEYIICRLEKMNNERAYCGPRFARYCSINHIEVRFTVVQGTKRIDQFEQTVTLNDAALGEDSYPNIRVFDEFFAKHPAWQPSKIEEALKP